MKKLNYLWMLGLLMFFSACSSDDDEGQGSASELVGLWELTSYKGWDKYDGEITNEWDEEADDSRIRFNLDGTCEDFEYYNNKWDFGDTGTWEYKGGKLYISSDDEGDYETDVLIVKELTSSRLVVEFYGKETYNGRTYESYECSVYRKVE